MTFWFFVLGVPLALFGAFALMNVFIVISRAHFAVATISV